MINIEDEIREFLKVSEEIDEIVKILDKRTELMFD